jgi:mono/diheme cytochrome c family protein
MERFIPTLPVFRSVLQLLLFAALPVFAAEPPKLDFVRYMEGKYLFERNCQVCHGARGDGNGEMAPTLSPRPRSFREGMFKFRTTPFGALPTEDDLRHTIKHGLTGTAMGMFSQLTDDDVTSLIEYVKSFSRRWRKAENYAEPLTFPEPPAWLEDARARAAQAEKGRGLFVTNCSACHGAAADGRGPAVPGLKDVWNFPARPSDLRQPHLRCGDRPQDVYRVLSTGLNGTPMVSFEGTLTPEQRWQIIAWIFTQKLPDVPTLGNAPPRETVKAGTK